jgi:hypothetical protein
MRPPFKKDPCHPENGASHYKSPMNAFMEYAIFICRWALAFLVLKQVFWLSQLQANELAI